ncbi:MAG: hypothetical protein IM456_09085 [Microcystis sp. M079S1]|uniref:hypothetical protein n=1 Tax=unclassified Microcystis TaxID=2643300 RepID=UPI00259012E9|nr:MULTISPECIES: hypothetical protein [unclassified Microcystis]MCA2666152.1 hypothetical protein [Microcystis sp. M045S2]MCA2712968.1 hypothetical protein [Microcystis sp. M172S2]MCA2836112.1 hypothetical protein [Microcystis sp. M007S1]MCA2838928.1 hypothetical protein [Microcystis sp. M078S1]MCA2842237.1 hypothetical protein [Microcystis sp. M079S1]
MILTLLNLSSSDRSDTKSRLTSMEEQKVGKRERVFPVGLGVNHAIKNRFSITAKISGGR